MNNIIVIKRPRYSKEGGGRGGRQWRRRRVPPSVVELVPVIQEVVRRQLLVLVAGEEHLQHEGPVEPHRLQLHPKVKTRRPSSARRPSNPIQNQPTKREGESAAAYALDGLALLRRDRHRLLRRRGQLPQHVPAPRGRKLGLQGGGGVNRDDMKGRKGDEWSAAPPFALHGLVDQPQEVGLVLLDHPHQLRVLPPQFLEKRLKETNFLRKNDRRTTRGRAGMHGGGEEGDLQDLGVGLHHGPEGLELRKENQNDE